MARILLIDDEDVLRTLVRAMLVASGHVVWEARDGKAGLDLFRTAAPDLVITDLLMPGMEGIETIQALKRVNASVKIIAMSGGGAGAHGEYLGIARKLGADATLAKPFSPAELEGAIASLLPADAPRSLTFLVLDDDAESRFLNRDMLETEFPRSTVVECGSVDEALRASENRRLDAVITDHHLGASDGSEFVRRLRENGASCPVIMVTGSSDPKVHERAYAAGASRVFYGSQTNFTSYLRGVLRQSVARS